MKRQKFTIIIIDRSVHPTFLGTVTATAIAAQSQTQREFWFINRDKNRTLNQRGFCVRIYSTLTQRHRVGVSKGNGILFLGRSSRWEHARALRGDQETLKIEEYTLLCSLLILELWYVRMLAVNPAVTSARRENSVLAFTLGGFRPLFDLPDLIAAKPWSSFSGETSSTLASMNTTIHSSHITRWRFQSCNRKVRP